MRTATTWRKGKSGNPGGRPKALHDVQALARSHTRAAVEMLAGIMDAAAAPAAARVSAANALLDRGRGRPVQAITQTMALPAVRAEDLSDDELAAIAASGGLVIGQPKDDTGVH
jgi:hypothetical protein